MKAYLGLELGSLAGGKDLSGLFAPGAQKLHTHVIQGAAMAEI